MAFVEHDIGDVDHEKLAELNEGLDRKEWRAVKRRWSDFENGSQAELYEMDDGTVLYYVCGIIFWSSAVEGLAELEPDRAVDVKRLTSISDELPFRVVDYRELVRLAEMAGRDEGVSDFDIIGEAEKKLGVRVWYCGGDYAVYNEPGVSFM